MDARVGDRVITPRVGKPVEVQALWYNALCTMQALALTGRDASSTWWRASKRRHGFMRLTRICMTPAWGKFQRSSMATRRIGRAVAWQSLECGGIAARYG